MSVARTVLVTGGGGFIGRAVVERLLARGDEVRSFSRQGYPELAAMGVDCRVGDLLDESAVTAACAGCELVFHVAARAGVWGPYEEYFHPNVTGTQHVVAGCREHGTRQLVYTSSPSVVFDGNDMAGVDESVPYPTFHHSHYSATKAIAERIVLAANGADLHTLALRPHLVWGPRDNHIVPRILEKGRAGQLRIIGKNEPVVDTTYIANAADAHLAAADALAANPGCAGRSYFISDGEPVRLWEIINGILAAADLPPVTRRVPKSVAVLGATVMEQTHKLLKRPGEPRMTRFVVEEMSTSHWFDISAARKLLGYEPKVSTQEGLTRLREWLRESN